MELENGQIRMPLSDWTSREVSDKYKSLYMVGQGTYG
jgi:hypothetical protein